MIRGKQSCMRNSQLCPITLYYHIYFPLLILLRAHCLQLQIHQLDPKKIKYARLSTVTAEVTAVAQLNFALLLPLVLLLFRFTLMCRFKNALGKVAGGYSIFSLPASGKLWQRTKARQNQGTLFETTSSLFYIS